MSVTSQATPPAAQPRSVNDATLQPGISSAKKRKIILSPSPTSPSTSHEENVIVEGEPRPSCQVNYAGTAGGMEAAEALACWNRSLSHNMRRSYTTRLEGIDPSHLIHLPSDAVFSKRIIFTFGHR
ncbi:hypothetical protein O3P69_006464 [Scylla paramamosain]|uniref:Uncharacterized protein n=1 Tax=Scylla paramamosain TaxID=85552 RepID=A0AAW0U5R1_SCYPA